MIAILGNNDRYSSNQNDDYRRYKEVCKIKYLTYYNFKLW